MSAATVEPLADVVDRFDRPRPPRQYPAPPSFAERLRLALHAELAGRWRLSDFHHEQGFFGAHVSFTFHCPCGNDLRENLFVHKERYVGAGAVIECALIEAYVRRMQAELEDHVAGDDKGGS